MNELLKNDAVRDAVGALNPVDVETIYAMTFMMTQEAHKDDSPEGVASYQELKALLGKVAALHKCIKEADAA